MAIVAKELISDPRRKWFRAKRVGLVAVAAAVLLWMFGLGASFRVEALGLRLFRSLALIVLSMVCVFSAAAGCAAIAREKIERTLGLVFLTGISPRQFVIGKLAHTLFHSLFTLLSMLPLFMLAISFGGVSAAQILAVFVLFLSNALLGASIGICAGTVAREERAANGLTLLGMLLFYATPPLLVVLAAWWADLRPSVLEPILFALSPFASMMAVCFGMPVRNAALNAVLTLLTAAACLAVSGRLLPGRVMPRERPGLRQRIKERLAARSRVRRWMEPSSIAGNPVAWKDFHFLCGGRPGMWLRFAVPVVLIALVYSIILIRTFTRRGMSEEDLAEGFLGVANAAAAILLAGYSVAYAARAFTSERRHRTLEVLLTTDLTDREIVFGKLRAVWQSVRPWFVFGVTSLMAGACWVLTHNPDDLADCAPLVLLYFVTAFGYTALAFWCSLRYRREIGFPIAVTLFVAWNWFGRDAVLDFLDFMAAAVLLGPGYAVVGPPRVLIRQDATEMAIELALHTLLGAVCLLLVLRRFRRTALREV